MLKLPEITPQKRKAEDIECNPSPACMLSVSSIVASKHNESLEKAVVHFEESFQGKKKTQFLAAFAANMGAFAIGTMMCWTATALPDLRNSETIGPITESQESVISSIVTLGAAAACPLTGYCVERFGRRKTMLALTIPFVAGWLLIAFAEHIYMIYAGRFITGYCGGAFSLAAPIFIAETADVDIRGKLSAGFDLMITIGMLFIFIVGTYISWQMQALVCGIIPVVFHLLMFFVPESPRYLISKGKETEAADALMWLRGAWIPEQIQAEFIEISNSIKETGDNSRSNWKSVLEPGALKAISIGMTLFFFQVVCGIDAILFYTVDIFRTAGSTLNEYSSTIILGAAQVVAAMSSALVVDKYGRRFFLLSSEIFMVISLSVLGAFFYLKMWNDDYITTEFGWIPLVSLIVYVVAFSIGLGPIPYGMMAELLPLNIKGVGSSLLTTTRWLLVFFVTRFFNDIMENAGRHVGYWLFTGLCMLGTVFIYLYVPETKGKSLEEIQERFITRKKIISN